MVPPTVSPLPVPGVATELENWLTNPVRPVENPEPVSLKAFVDRFLKIITAPGMADGAGRVPVIAAVPETVTSPQ